MQGSSLVHLQTVRFTPLPANMVYAFLQDGERLYCVEDTPQRAFWTYWGDPAFDTPRRESLANYGLYERDVRDIITRINTQYGQVDWQPIVAALGNNRVRALAGLRLFPNGCPKLSSQHSYLLYYVLYSRRLYC